MISTFLLAYLLLTGQVDEQLGGDGQVGGATLALMRCYVALVYGSLFPTLWVAWDFLTRGGFALRLAGLGLIRWDGRKASRWRCAWRSLLVWAPPFALLIASVWLQMEVPTPEWPRWAAFGSAVALLPIYVASALASPSCGPHDRLSGLRVVPR